MPRPQLIDQPLGRDHLSAAERQHGEERTGTTPGQRDAAVAVDDLQRAEDADLRRCPPIRDNRAGPSITRVRLPAEYEGDEDQVIAQWASVVLHDGELTWLREAVLLNAADDTGDDEDLEPLN